MDAPHQLPTDAELIEHAQGMALDTATIFEDAARRLPSMAYELYALAIQLRRAAEGMSHATTPTDTQTDHTAGA